MALKYSTELGALDRMKNDLAFRVRRRIFETFMRECAPGSDARVADFGVSGHRCTTSSRRSIRTGAG